MGINFTSMSAMVTLQNNFTSMSTLVALINFTGMSTLGLVTFTVTFIDVCQVGRAVKLVDLRAFRFNVMPVERLWVRDLL